MSFLKIEHPTELISTEGELSEYEKENFKNLLLENIIDEPIIDITDDFPLPNCILEIDSIMNDILKNSELAKDYPDASGSRKAPMHYVISGGLLSRIITAHIRGIASEIPNILKETDMDIFFYYHSGVTPTIVEALSQKFEIHTAESFETEEYINSLNISGLIKGSYNEESPDIEFIFSSPNRIQAFDINNRNIFLQNGRLFATKSALTNLQKSEILITSVHTPVSSLIRALSFAESEDMFINPDSIKLLKWIIKEFKVNISDDIIHNAISRRKLTSSQKELVYREFRKLFPIADLTTEVEVIPHGKTNSHVNLLFTFKDGSILEKKHLTKRFTPSLIAIIHKTLSPPEEDYTYKLNGEEILEEYALSFLETNKSDLVAVSPIGYTSTSTGIELSTSKIKETKEILLNTKIHFSKLYNRLLKRQAVVTTIRGDAEGYDYPFHPETLQKALRGHYNHSSPNAYNQDDYPLEANTDVSFLHWTKSFYDSLANYQPLEFKLPQPFTYDITQQLSLTGIYQHLYLGIFDFISKNSIKLHLEYDKDIIREGFLKNPSINRNDNIAMYIPKCFIKGEHSVVFEKYFDTKLSFVKMKEHLLDKDFLYGTLIYFLQINKHRSKTNFERDDDDIDKANWAATLATFLLKHTYLNHLHLYEDTSVFGKEAVMQTDLKIMVVRGHHDSTSSRLVEEVERALLEKSTTKTYTIQIKPIKPIEPIEPKKIHAQTFAIFSKMLRNNKYTLNSYKKFNPATHHTDKIAKSIFKEEYFETCHFLNSEGYMLLYYLKTQLPQHFGNAVDDDRVKGHARILDYKLPSYRFNKYTGELTTPLNNELTLKLDNFFKNIVKLSS